MTIEIKPGRYFIGIWFVGDGRKDWMAAIYRDPGETQWHIQYRFRYYKGPDAWDGKDEKNWYSGVSQPGVSESEAKDKMDLMAEVVAVQFGEIEFVPMYSDDVSENIERFRKASFASTKEMSKEDAEKEGYL